MEVRYCRYGAAEPKGYFRQWLFNAFSRHVQKFVLRNLLFQLLTHFYPPGLPINLPVSCVHLMCVYLSLSLSLLRALSLSLYSDCLLVLFFCSLHLAPLHSFFVCVLRLQAAVASGKSTAAAHLRESGFHVIDADVVAHQLYVIVL